jgi:hypothetical protein
MLLVRKMNGYLMVLKNYKITVKRHTIKLTKFLGEKLMKMKRQRG